MTALEIFRYEDRQVRTVIRDGVVWFVARDIGEALELRNVRQLLPSLDEHDVSTAYVADALGRDQDTSIVNESGLYDLIFRSRKPEARAFKRWVTSEVLPAIRRDGGYISPDASHEQLVQLADRAAAQARVLTALQGIVDSAWLEAKARHVAARALGEEPEVEHDSRPLTVGEYLEDRGVPTRLLRKVSPNVGKRVKALYRAEHGVDPPVVDRFVDGALRKVAAYTESERHLFDRAWSEFDEDS